MGEKKGIFKISKVYQNQNQYRQWNDAIFSGFSSIDDDFYEELGRDSIMADLGINITYLDPEDLREKVKENKIKEPAQCRQLLMESMINQMN